MKKEIIKDKVEALLKKYPDTRDSDKILWLVYLNRYYGLKENMNISKKPYETFKKLILNSRAPKFETIRRVRQKFQEEGNYLGVKRKAAIRKANNAKRKKL